MPSAATASSVITDWEVCSSTTDAQCLSKLILFGEGPLSRALAEFSIHYHGERNHQGKGNKLLFPEAGVRAAQRSHGVECHHRLGGLLKYYRRAA